MSIHLLMAEKKDQWMYNDSRKRRVHWAQPVPGIGPRGWWFARSHTGRRVPWSLCVSVGRLLRLLAQYVAVDVFIHATRSLPRAAVPSQQIFLGEPVVHRHHLGAAAPAWPAKNPLLDLCPAAPAEAYSNALPGLTSW